MLLHAVIKFILVELDHWFGFNGLNMLLVIGFKKQPSTFWGVFYVRQGVFPWFEYRISCMITLWPCINRLLKMRELSLCTIKVKTDGFVL